MTLLCCVTLLCCDHPVLFCPAPRRPAPVCTKLLLLLQFLQDSLHRLSPPTLAGLLTCHPRLGLGATTKLLRRAAAEYQRRPEPHPSLDMLSGIMEGLAAGGKEFIRELPQQLMVRCVCLLGWVAC